MKLHTAWVVAGLLLAAAAPVTGETDPEQPLTGGLTEEIEVRLVIVDVLVLDRKGRTQDDLTLDDFELFVDQRRRSIDTLDVICPDGRTEDARPLSRRGAQRAAIAPRHERRVVLVFDYLHIDQIRRYDVLERAQEMIAETVAPNEQLMVVALTGERPRIEQSFTRDRLAVVESLSRMQHDLTLWEPAFDHLHEHRFFRDLKSVLDLLEAIPGPKAVVLFSNLAGPAASYDLEFEELATRATRSRVSVYPVLARGLGRATSERLARMAVETGGRFTENTNDLSLAYARAQRDLTCRYQLGFYDRGTPVGQQRRISVRVTRPRARAIHATSYGFPKERTRVAAQLWSAYLAPQLFASRRIQGRFLALIPAPGGSRWDGVLAVDFPIEADWLREGDVVRDVGFTARRGHHFSKTHQRRVVVHKPAPGETFEGRIALLEPVRLKPGRLTVTAVVADPTADRPEASSHEMTLAPPPAGRPFVLGPFPGRSSGGGPVVEERTIPKQTEQEPEREDDELPRDDHPNNLTQAGLPDGFRPVLGPESGAPRATMALTRVCGVNLPGDLAVDSLSRRLLSEDGRVVLDLGEAQALLEPIGGGQVACHTQLDRLAQTNLVPGRYRFEIRFGALVRDVAVEIGP